MKQTNGMYINFSRIVPTLFELVGILLLTLLVVLLGNTKQLLDYYGLSGSGDVIKHSTSAAISNGLAELDGFSLTDKIVTFMVWAVIGVLCFSVVQVIAGAYRDFEENEKVSSNRYVHPSTFVRGAFWRKVILNFIGTLAGLIILGAALYCLLAYVLPVALANTSTFLTKISLGHVGSFLLGSLMLYGWIFVLTIILKI